MSLADYRTAQQLRAAETSLPALLMAVMMHSGGVFASLKHTFPGVARELRDRHLSPDAGRLPGDPPETDLAVAVARTADLTAREVQILALVAQGRRNKEVAQAVQLSEYTVKTHLARISRKLGVRGRAALVTAATRAGYLEAA